MRYQKALKDSVLFAGLIFGVSLLTFRAIDFYASVFALSSFFLLFIERIGKDYLTLTNQSKTVKTVFRATVDPFLTFVVMGAIFYVLSGEFNWILMGGAIFITFIVFVATVFSDPKEARTKK